MILQGVDSRTGPSFTVSNRVMRLAWSLAWRLLFRTSPRPMHAWRRGLLRLFGARIGQHVHIHASCRVWAPWQLQIGDQVGVGEGVHFYNMAPITVGHEAVISQGVHLCAGTHDYNSRCFQLVAHPISIGKQAWVCTEAFIGPGVSVPEGCVVGARAVMTRTPIDGAWRVYAGNPAQPIKRREIRD